MASQQSRQLGHCYILLVTFSPAEERSATAAADETSTNKLSKGLSIFGILMLPNLKCLNNE